MIYVFILSPRYHHHIILGQSAVDEVFKHVQSVLGLIPRRHVTGVPQHVQLEVVDGGQVAHRLLPHHILVKQRLIFSGFVQTPIVPNPVHGVEHLNDAVIVADDVQRSFVQKALKQILSRML